MLVMTTMCILIFDTYTPPNHFIMILELGCRQRSAIFVGTLLVCAKWSDNTLEFVEISFDDSQQPRDWFQFHLGIWFIFTQID